MVVVGSASRKKLVAISIHAGGDVLSDALRPAGVRQGVSTDGQTDGRVDGPTD